VGKSCQVLEREVGLELSIFNDRMLSIKARGSILGEDGGRGRLPLKALGELKLGPFGFQFTGSLLLLQGLKVIV